MDHVIELDEATMLTTPEAGRRLGITTREVYDLIDAGDLPVLRTDHGPRIPLDAIEERMSAT